MDVAVAQILAVQLSRQPDEEAFPQIVGNSRGCSLDLGHLAIGECDRRHGAGGGEVGSSSCGRGGSGTWIGRAVTTEKGVFGGLSAIGSPSWSKYR